MLLCQLLTFKNRHTETQRDLVNLNPCTSDSKAYCVLCCVDLDKMDVWGTEGINRGVKKVHMWGKWSDISGKSLFYLWFHNSRPDSLFETAYTSRDPCQNRRGTLKFPPQFEKRPSSIAPNPVVSREAPPTSSFPGLSEPDRKSTRLNSSHSH